MHPDIDKAYLHAAQIPYEPMPPAYTAGLVTASACGPEPLEPAVLLAAIFEDSEGESPDPKLTKAIEGLLASVAAYEEEVQSALSETQFLEHFDALNLDIEGRREWCAGFSMGILLLDDLWTRPEHAACHNMALMFASVEQPELREGLDLGEELNNLLDSVLDHIPEIVDEIYDYWQVWLEENAPHETPRVRPQS